MYWKEYGRRSPYRLNKKKEPALTEGKFLYYYLNGDAPNGYETIEVSEKECETLVALDKAEYSNNRRHDEKKTDLRETYYDDDDESGSDDGGGLYYSNKRLVAYEKAEAEQLEDFICESLDKGELVHSFSDVDFSIYFLAIEKKINQNKVAEMLNLSTAFVCRRVKKILHGLLVDKMDTGEYSPSRTKAEAEYRWFMETGETDSFADVKTILFLMNLKQELRFRYFYCFFKPYQLFHYCFIFLCRLGDINPEKMIPLYFNKMEPYSRKLYERNTRGFGSILKLLFIFLELKSTDNLKRNGVYNKPADKVFIEKVRKTANRCQMSVEDFRNKRLFPCFTKKALKRIEKYCKKKGILIPKAKTKPRKAKPQVKYRYRFR